MPFGAWTISFGSRWICSQTHSKRKGPWSTSLWVPSWMTFCSIPQLNTLGVILYMPLGIVRWQMHSIGWEDCICDCCVMRTPPQGQPHSIFRGFLCISGGWTLLGKELIVAEDSPHVTVQHVASPRRGGWTTLRGTVRAASQTSQNESLRFTEVLSEKKNGGQETDVVIVEFATPFDKMESALMYIPAMNTSGVWHFQSRFIFPPHLSPQKKKKTIDSCFWHVDHI